MGAGAPRRHGRLALAAVGAVLAVAAVAPATRAQPPPVPPPPPGTITDRQPEPEDRYALAGGCYVVRSVATGGYLARTGSGFSATATPVEAAEPFRFRATDLGRYLLFGTAGDFLTVDGRATGAPGPAADWAVDEPSDGTFTLRLAGSGEALSAGPDGRLTMAAGPTSDVTAGFEFRLADGCADFPEIELNVTGPHLRGETPYEAVTGYIDAHIHLTAFEFLGGRVHCGRPWDAYGVAVALVDCPDHLLADGAGAVLENFLKNPLPVGSHDTVGWPTFRDWPAYNSLTHEQVYYRWLERAWRAGERMFVNLFTDNRVLCELYPLKKNSCDEMASVRLQTQRIRELERYIDAQSGGPGEGWFRIVDDPFEARQVINEGKLAVVLGIEISEPFGCRISLGVPQCDEAEIDAQLDALHALGVRQLVAIHKFDNAFGGVAGDGGTTGVVVNLGNFYGTGQFWDFETCDPENTGVHDNDQGLPVPELTTASNLFGAILSQFGAGGVLPAYPPPHHCNTVGLSPLGAYAVQAMVDRRMLVDIDHMSVRARQDALDLLEADAYSGVVSSHSWATPDAFPRVYALGGFTAPYAGGSTGFANAWRERRVAADDRYFFGIGFGADSNGLGTQGAPRGTGVENPVTYPFEGLGGVIVDRQVSGSRVFDINSDGVAHYGLHPDWIEDLRQLVGDEIVDDLARGSEAYLQTWERAVGVPGPGCRGAEAFEGLRAGMTPEEVLRVAGQPDDRQGSLFHYCEVTLAFDETGRLAAAAGPIGPVGAAGGGLSASLPATGGGSPLAPIAAGSLLLAAVAALSFVRATTGARPNRSTAATTPTRRRWPSPRR